jgi:hypothetical protein
MSHEKVLRAKALRPSFRERLLNNDEFYLYNLMPNRISKMQLETSLWSNLDFRIRYSLGHLPGRGLRLNAAYTMKEGQGRAQLRSKAARGRTQLGRGPRRRL